MLTLEDFKKFKDRDEFLKILKENNTEDQVKDLLKTVDY